MRRAWVLVAVLVLGAWTCAPVDDGGADVSMTTTGYAALAAGEGWHYVGESGEPAFENSWQNSSSDLPNLAFRIREAGIVDIYGVVNNGASGSTVFTLPAGYRPSGPAVFPSVRVGGSPAAYSSVLVYVGADGVVQPSYDGTLTNMVLHAQIFLDLPLSS